MKMDYKIEDRQEDYVIAALAQDVFGRKNLKQCELEHMLEEIYPEPEREPTMNRFSDYLL